MSDNCPQCGKATRCLGGCSAHPLNWYCKDTEGCGWQAWGSRSINSLPSINPLSLVERARVLNKRLRVSPAPISTVKPIISELVDRVEELEGWIRAQHSALAGCGVFQDLGSIISQEKYGK